MTASRRDVREGARHDRPRERAPRSGAHTIVTTIVANFALPASALLTAPILARALGPVGRGEVTAVCAPLNLAVMLLSVGQWDASSFFGADRRRDPWSIVRTSGLVSLVAAVVGVTVLIAANPCSSRGHDGVKPLAIALAFLLFVYLPANSVRGLLLGRHDFRALNVEKWVSVLVRLVLVVAMGATGLLTVTSAAWITQGAVALAALLLPLLLLRALRRDSDRPLPEGGAAPGAGAEADRGVDGTRGPARSGLTATRLQEVLGYGLRVWGGGLSVVLIYRADQAIMSPLTTAEQLGFYAVAASIAEVPAAAFAALRDISFSRSAGGSTDSFLPAACRTSVLVGVPAVALAVVVCPLLVTVVFGADFAPATPMMQVLVVAALPAGLASICGAGLNAVNRPGTLSGVQVGVAVVNVVLTVVLVPRTGGMGAAWATLVGYGLLGVVTVALYSRLAGIDLRRLLVPGRADARALVAVLRPAR